MSRKLFEIFAVITTITIGLNIINLCIGIIFSALGRRYEGALYPGWHMAVPIVILLILTAIEVKLVSYLRSEHA